MAYIYVEDFRGGLDRRKHPIAGVSGSLYTLENAHLTRGGEIEKRYAMVSTYTLPAGTFGCKGGAGLLYVFGSAADPGVPVGVTYQRLQHPDSTPTMTALLWAELFGGLVYAIAEYDDDSVFHFYDGELVTDWGAGVVRAGMTDMDGVAEHLKGLIDASADFTATRAGSVITITGAVGTTFDYEATAVNGDGNPLTDESAVVALVQSANETVAAISATFSFSVTAGTASAGVNKVSSITINGLEVLNTAVDWATSNADTAAAIAAQINTYNSIPEYTATSLGQTVTISAAATSGATPNGYSVVVTKAGDVVIDPAIADGISGTLTNGVTAVVGQPQIVTVTLGGSFEVGDSYYVTLNATLDDTVDTTFGAVNRPVGDGRIAKTFRSKIYIPVGSVVNFPKINDPTVWDIQQVGAGFVNLANHSEGSEALTAMGAYQNYMAFFARNNIQIWSLFSDDTSNAQQQIIENSGTRSPRSVLSYGSTDTFYLADSGIRSLRALNSSNAAYANDVGTAIDSYVLELLADMADAEIEAACAIIEPRSGRYWLQLGELTMVLSYFPGSKVSAWSVYNFGMAITDFTLVDGRIYARAGDTIYLYGGATGTEFDSCTVTVQTNFLNGGKPGHLKELTAIDIAGENTWDVSVLTDPRDHDIEVVAGTLPAVTFPMRGIPMAGQANHFALKMVCSEAGAAKISCAGLYYIPPKREQEDA